MTRAQQLLGVVTEGVLDPQAHLDAVSLAVAGGDVLFCGVIRDNDHGREVAEIEYLAHPNAQAVLEQVLSEFASEAKVSAVIASHRTGSLKIGDVALVAAVAGVHRAEAFDACSRLVDELKARLPIWKRQVFVDGTDEWVNCP